MTLSILRISAALVIATALPALPVAAQIKTTAPSSPYGGTTVEEIIARVNDQIITTSDYERAMQELDQEERQHGATMQEMSEAHKDLLRNLIDQQLWLSKGKELGITGETELVTRLNEIRKQYNLASLEDLEKAAKDQGFSYEDFKANLRNQIITQDVMRQEVGSRINITPGEVQRYFEAHKQEYAQPESIKLSEILISTGTPGATGLGEDPQKVAEAQAKANDLEAKLHAGGDFTQLARNFSDGTTASSGGDLGTYKRGQLGQVFEDATFPLKVGEYTQPIRTKQGFVILKVDAHTPGGVPPYKDVEQDVEQNYYMSRMEPKIREYLTTMRDDASIDIKPGYVDTGASPNKQIYPISYSAYAPPSSKKKRKIERTRFRETTRGFRQKSKPSQVASTEEAPVPETGKKASGAPTTEKPGKKEKIRFGKAPTKTLPATPAMQTEDAGAGTQTASNGNEPANPLESQPAQKKTRFSDRARQPKQPKGARAKQNSAMTPQAPDAAEVADRQTQSGSLGLGGDASNKKKKGTATGEKTRMSDRKKSADQNAQPVQPTPMPPVAGAPAPQQAPANPSQQPATQPQP
ncbi:MAG TPA: peptidylprolyl isomerase [Terracidiphilus sp.]|nr:peptidylprolyl isomerase [Terracidiphilus sp.]